MFDSRDLRILKILDRIEINNESNQITDKMPSFSVDVGYQQCTFSQSFYDNHFYLTLASNSIYITFRGCLFISLQMIYFDGIYLVVCPFKWFI